MFLILHDYLQALFDTLGVGNLKNSGQDGGAAQGIFDLFF